MNSTDPNEWAGMSILSMRCLSQLSDAFSLPFWGLPGLAIFSVDENTAEKGAKKYPVDNGQ